MSWTGVKRQGALPFSLTNSYHLGQCTLSLWSLPPSVKWECRYWHTCLTRTFWNNFAHVFIFTEHLHNHDLTYSRAHSFNKYHWQSVTCLSFCQILAIQMVLLSGNCYSDGGHSKVNKQLKHNVIDVMKGISVECFEILTMVCETSREAVIIPVLQMRKLRFHKYNDLSKITYLANGRLRTWTPFSWFLTEMFFCCRSLYPVFCKTIKGYYVYWQCIASAEHNIDSSTVESVELTEELVGMEAWVEDIYVVEINCRVTW